MKIAIVSDGEIGAAFSQMLIVHNDVELWDKDRKRNLSKKTIEEVVKDVDLVVYCVPSWTLEQVLASSKPALSKKTQVIMLSKGVQVDTGRLPYEVLKSYFKPAQFGILAGPMLAEEMIAGAPTFGVLATTAKPLYNKFAQALADSNLHLEHSSDIAGVNTASVLKNIYAVASGIANCLEWSENSKAWLATQSILEMQNLEKILGGKKHSTLGLAGIGDYIATSFSEFSLNRQAGEELVKHGSCKLATEGVVSLIPLCKRLLKIKAFNFDHFPILLALHEVLGNKKATEDVFNKLIEKE